MNMSEQINNREFRKNVIKQVILELHEGKSVEDVKQKFEDAFAGVSAMEISEAEQALINEGLAVSEVQSLCDVHAAVFKGSIEEIHQSTDQSEIPGHPVNILKRENRALEKLINMQLKPHLDALKDNDGIEMLKSDLEVLSKIDLHYLKKENLLFPYMEKYGITAPPKVMWGVDDEIRAQLKQVKLELSIKGKSFQEQKDMIESLAIRIKEMIFKEENIMLPMLIDLLTQEEWKSIADESGEIGYMIDNVPEWKPSSTDVEDGKNEGTIKDEEAHNENVPIASGVINFPTGQLKFEELNKMLDMLPFDITFVDKEDTVKYFSQGEDRIFPRTKAVIGRKVSNCHPPASAHIVEKIVEDFKAGKKDHEDFWINMGGRFVLIRYYAVRSETGEYLGVLEVTQDIKPIQEITGEKRLVTE